MGSRCVVGLLVAVVGFTAAGCGASKPDTPAAPTVVTVTYEGDFQAPEVFKSIHGATYKDGAADATYTTAAGVGQQQDIAVPIKTQSGEGIHQVLPAGNAVVFSLQNKKDYGDITCRIRGSDGSVISEQTSRGPYAVASCQGFVR